ncbi:hypothetical protein IV487_00665 [Enterococcus saccharolyticus]|uniref:hypothetical protein n=1 Tax=Enterococcus TaxID=1350 RepID=UPI001E60D9BC|nr:hypothetical protein [Enterococcus saccharolyticus]MCD5000987.1 hypothetical protein [Enterococcus saccharolyticus]
MKQNFDERQLLVRQKGYKYAFIMEMVLIVIFYTDTLFATKEYFTMSAILALLLFLPVIFVTGYMVLNDAYYRVNEFNKLGFSSLFFLGLGLFHLYIFLSSQSYQRVIVDGQVTNNIVSVLSAIMFLNVGLCSSYKYLQNRRTRKRK